MVAIFSALQPPARLQTDRRMVGYLTEARVKQCGTEVSECVRARGRELELGAYLEHGKLAG